MNNDGGKRAFAVHFAWVLGLVCGVEMTAHGQAEGFRMGLAIEPNVAWMNSRDFEHTTDGGRAHFGYQFMADILFAETYAIGTGLHVFRTGSTAEYWEPTTDSTLSHVSRNFNNQYVELPMTFKLRTKEIGYTTYFGKFGGGIGLNTRREANEVRYVGFERTDGIWTPVDNPLIPAEDQISGDYASLFRASMIVGLGFERRIAGTTALMVGLTYNNSLFSTHKDQTVVKVDASGVPRFATDQPLTTAMVGHDSFMALTLGVVF
jgi:hypothetical protein